MGGAESCSLCANSEPPKTNKYQYQVYKKKPTFGTLKDYQKIVKENQLYKQGNSFYQGLRSSIAQRNSADLPQVEGANIPPPPEIVLKSCNLVQHIPVQTAHTAGSIFDLAGEQTYVKKIKKSNYTEIIKSLEGTDQKYTDLQFGHNEKSIGKVPNLDLSKVQWLRVSQLMKNPLFVRDSIQPSDILQGVLGDCYFLSSMASMAEQDYRIMSIFPSLEISPYGIYMARVLHNGVYQQVTIDDYFPANASGEPIFAKPSGKNEIWVMVLEKCWAKLYGSYENIAAGLPNQVLHAFSTAPVFLKMIYSDPMKQEAMWSQLLQFQRNGVLSCCGTKNDPAIEKLGFVKGHAYTILGVYDKPERLIKLRNPWGFKQWRGKASDHDLEFWKKLSAQEKAALDYEDSKRSTDKDGVFFIVWADFLKYFQLIDVCKINDNAHYNFLQSDFDHLKPKLFEFEIRGSEAMVTFAVTQANKRGTTINSYSRSYLALGKWDQDSKTYKYVKGGSDKRMADNYLEVTAASTGKYVLYVNYLWLNKIKNSAVVSIYSVSPAHIVELKDKISPQDFLRQIYYDHATKNQKKKFLSDKGDKSDWFCSELLLSQGGFSYFVVDVNRQSKNKYRVTVTQSQYRQKMLEPVPPFQGRQTIDEEVSASKRPFILVAELISFPFPQKASNPTPTVAQMQ